jgi:hypothetical protein
LLGQIGPIRKRGQFHVEFSVIEELTVSKL